MPRGITIPQKLDTAGQPDMPESAIASGCVDFVLSPEDIALELARISRLRKLHHNKLEIAMPVRGTAALAKAKIKARNDRA
jgi:hypothetical protein